MKKINGKFKRDSSNAIGRWAAVGPYYAMFPLEFAFDVVNEYSKQGQLVLDPFAGRASSVYAAATQKRQGLGIEINPVGWVYAQAKLNPAPQQDVENRLKSLISISEEFSQQPEELTDFFQMCYSEKVLNFLLTAREHLDWKKNQVDCTLMVFLLIYLHGKLGEGLSNQMRQAKAMWPSYSIQWWQNQKLTNPPEILIEEFLLKRIKWRYNKGTPKVTEHSKVELGDSTQILPNFVEAVNNNQQKQCSLLFTSPPYQGVTNYHVDQWLRLWLLGDPPKLKYDEKKHRGKFSSKEAYRELLDSVFKSVSKIMSENSTIYVRTSAREFTFKTTIEILRKYFPPSSWTETITSEPFVRKTQTHLFGDSREKPGEKDIILTTK
jgi:DNA modification methylase